MGRVKEIKRTANVAWSPRSIQSMYLAAGTVAQQLDATFSTTASLEIFQLDLSKGGEDMPLVGSIETKQRFHKLIWSGFGLDDSYPMGVVVGGSDNGSVTLWNVEKIANSESEDALITSLDQHIGAVRALDVNPFQSNLIASGASESEVFIWDLNNPSNPMSPGNKLHPLEDISGIAWNMQVQHILASTSPNGRSVVWDLRKNEPIIQVSDSNSRIRCKSIAWHPEVATQLVTGSEDDRSPIIQLWDLRYATAPLRVLEQHQRGVLSLSWCPQDADLLLSAAKDNHVYCWNPNTDVPGGEVVYELPATSQWIFECQWCPRNPAIISTSSFDGHVTLYSLLGGGGASDDNKGLESPVVDTSDPFSAIAAQKTKRVDTAPLKTPPKWFRRPCGARFGFGGQLVSFSSTNQPSPSVVHISQVVTEPQLLKQSDQFETAMSQHSYLEYCSNKISSDPEHEQIWKFLKAKFEPEPRRHYLNLLGLSPEKLAEEVNSWIDVKKQWDIVENNDKDEGEESVATLPLTDPEGETAPLFDSEGPRSPFDDIAREVTPPTADLFTFATGEDGNDLDDDCLLTKALLVGNFKAAVDVCIKTDRMSEALILSVAGGSELFQSTQKQFFESKKSDSTKLISLITSRKWSDIAQYGDLTNWREILSCLVTYSTNEDFTKLCDVLGRRLEETGDEGCYDNAALCYICSGNVAKFVECCLRSRDGSIDNPLTLQELIEEVMLLREAIRSKSKGNPVTIDNGVLTEQLGSYAALLASQGALKTALLYLEQTTSDQSDVNLLHDRLSQHLRGTSPRCPFQQVNVKPVAPVVTPTVPMTTPTSTSMMYTNMYQPKVPENEVTKGLNNQPQPTYYNNMMGGARHDYSHQVPPMVPSSHGTMAPPIQAPPTYNPPSVDMYPPPGSHSFPGAWNDPPTLRHAKKQPKVVAPPVPMTSPLALAPVEDSPHHAPANVPSVPPPSTGPPTSNMQPNPVAPVKATAPDPIPQQPIPPEHEILHSVFNGLLMQCKSRANNNVMRRKVDEISRKLDILYDLIRQSRLSPDVLQGLHAIAQDVQGVNYVSGLARLTHMVSTSNLSEISSFMPGIKTLLQLGMQLRV
ncbi:PREDICTED: protein transport protein Sec31A-like [Amphimedon queenslandica]|uniref:Uncharacterized protein n=1 Tax=Amphimedon queenslandica TaxID=400682 RepID=A0A1X7V5Q5_AMPQE|nr:PREDICTED: protein transport protein Sec31A-like [Amphimedon queenslandica]|eukprot:XP_019850594.1 PREDICTED: protein transport protein Sec31A-like [Amphimedon queenslandica]